MTVQGTRKRFLEVVKAEVGYKEGPSNRTKYGRYTGYQNQPWCASFCKWCADQAGVELPGWSAYVPTWLSYVQKAAISGPGTYRSVNAKNALPLPGDIVFFDFAPGTGPAEHVGVVTSGGSWDATKTVQTVEGNTWSGTGTYQGNGDGCYARTRNATDILGFWTPTFVPGRRQRLRDRIRQLRTLLAKLRNALRRPKAGGGA